MDPTTTILSVLSSVNVLVMLGPFVLAFVAGMIATCCCQMCCGFMFKVVDFGDDDDESDEESEDSDDDDDDDDRPRGRRRRTRRARPHKKKAKRG